MKRKPNPNQPTQRFNKLERSHYYYYIGQLHSRKCLFKNIIRKPE